MSAGEPDIDRRGDALFGLAVAAVVILGLLLRSAFEFRINTDATAYVSIARQCLAGDFGPTVNGYWGPLLSWLMIPLLAAGVAPLWAARLVELGAAAATLFAARWLALQLGASRRWAGVMALCLAVPLVSYALILVTPDVLLLLLLTMYCGVVLPDAYRSRAERGVAAGFFGGLAYLAKSYALPFFAVHFLLINLLHFRRAGAAPADATAAPAPDRASRGNLRLWIGTALTVPRRRVLRNYVLGLVAFAAVAGPWVGLLTHKYGAFTFGTAGQRAFAMVGPDYYGDDPVFETVIPPPTPDATSYWDDPTVDKLPSWRPWESMRLFRHQLKLLKDNIGAMTQQIVGLMPFALATLLFCAGALFRGARGKTGPEPRTPAGTSAVPILLTAAVFAAGYMPIFVEIRYLWFVLLLLLLLTVLVLQQCADAYRLGAGFRSFLAACLIVTCAAPAAAELAARSGQGRQHADLAAVLSRDFKIHGNLASNDRWDKSLFAAFHMKARYFGMVPRDVGGDEASLLPLLRKHAVDYYLVWGAEADLGNTPFPANRLPEVTGGAIAGLRIYAIPRP